MSQLLTREKLRLTRGSVEVMQAMQGSGIASLKYHENSFKDSSSPRSTSAHLKKFFLLRGIQLFHVTIWCTGFSFWYKKKVKSKKKVFAARTLKDCFLSFLKRRKNLGSCNEQDSSACSTFCSLYSFSSWTLLSLGFLARCLGYAQQIGSPGSVSYLRY